MELVLHVGAHRTASTSFQAYLKQNRDELGQWGIGFWGPHRTRKGLFAGVVPRNGYGLQEDQLRRAKGRISMQLARTEMQGARTLIVSDENMLGSVRDNLAAGIPLCAGRRQNGAVQHGLWRAGQHGDDLDPFA